MCVRYEIIIATFVKRMERKMTRKIINNSGTRRKFRVK